MNQSLSHQAQTKASSPGTPGGRIPHIDLMETLAMLFVLTYHLSACRYKFLEEPGMEQLVNYYLRGFLVCCVPMFLATNGYLMFHHSLDLKKHLKKTLRYAVITLFWAVVTLPVYNRCYGVQTTGAEFLQAIFTWRGGVIHLWYMGALVIIYLLFPVLKALYDDHRKLFGYVIALLAVMSFGNQLLGHVATIGAAALGKHHHWVIYSNLFSMFNPVPEIPAFTIVYFCLGAYLQDLLDYLRRFRRRTVNLVAGAGLAVAGVLHAVWFLLLWKGLDMYYCPIWYGYESVTGFLISLFVMVLCGNYQGKHLFPVVSLVSKNTLGIYFLHLGNAVLYPYGQKLQEIPLLFNMPANLIIAAAAMAVCLGLTLILKKIPVLRKLVS